MFGFIIGLVLGAFVGVCLMALLQISKNNKGEKK